MCYNDFMEIKGFVADYSFTHPNLFQAKNEGLLGVVRYLGYDFKYSYNSSWNSRTISPAEIDAIYANGLDYALVWETTANMTLGGTAGGTKDGIEANKQADYLGFPKDRPLYVAVDFQAVGSQFATIKAYKEAFEAQGRSVLMYGMYSVIEYFGDGWQCAAWSGSGTGTGGSSNSGGRENFYRPVSKHARMYQRIGYILGNSSDENEVYVDDWGQSKYQSEIVVAPPKQIEPLDFGDDEMPHFIGRDPRDGSMWEICGLWKRYIGDMSTVEILHTNLGIEVRGDVAGQVIDSRKDVETT